MEAGDIFGIVLLSLLGIALLRIFIPVVWAIISEFGKWIYLDRLFKGLWWLITRPFQSNNNSRDRARQRELARQRRKDDKLALKYDRSKLGKLREEIKEAQAELKEREGRIYSLRQQANEALNQKKRCERELAKLRNEITERERKHAEEMAKQAEAKEQFATFLAKLDEF